jgi:hypothetical protein
MIGASSAFLFVSPLLAETPSDIAPATALDSWVQQVDDQIGRAIVSSNDASGTVDVTFRRGEDGHPADVQVRATDPLLAASARATVQRIGRLPALPVGIDPHKLVHMQLLFDNGDNLAAYHARRRAMFAAASEANRDLAARLSDTQVAVSR